MRGAVWLPLLLLGACVLAGCGAPADPSPEVMGSTGLLFPSRPLGTVHGLDVVWDAIVQNADNTTAAAARLHLEVRYRDLGGVDRRTVQQDAPIDPMPPHVTLHYPVKTPYDGPGDYSGTAEIIIGQRVVARTFVFTEKCQAGAMC